MGGPINQSISPGIEGFVVTFLIACALWLLMRNMSTRLRNLRYREEAEEERRRTQEARGVDTRPAAAGVRPREDATADPSVPQDATSSTQGVPPAPRSERPERGERADPADGAGPNS